MPWQAKARRACAVLLLLCAASMPLRAAEGLGPAAAPGPVMAIGGALREDNARVWERLVALAGGPGARIAVFPTASDDPRLAAENAAATLRRYGADPRVIPVAPNWPDSDALAAARDPQWLAQLAEARGAFFTGGTQARIVDTLAPGGVASPLLEALRALHARGGLIAGTSAGAAVLGRTIILDIEDPHSALKGRLRDGQELGRGLDFLPANLLLDQHFLARGRLARLLPAMVERGLVLGVGVDENTAAVLQGETLEVLGASAVLFVELDAAERQAGRAPFALRDARLALLADGDCANLRTREIEPAPHKRAGQFIDPAAAGFKPYHARAPFYLDLLAPGALREALVRLLDSPARETRGLAYDAAAPAGEPLAALGFEFRLRKAPDTRGWYAGAGGGEPYTIVGLRLDVMPVRVAQPIYGAWTP